MISLLRILIFIGLASPASAQSFAEIIVAQHKLKALGFLTDDPDGRVGAKTRKALEVAGEKYGFAPTVNDFYKYFSREVNLGTTRASNEPAAEAAQEAVRDLLKDPFSAHFKDLLILPSGTICGSVNAKNVYGAYTGWTTFTTVGAPIKIGDKYMALAAL